MPTDQIQLRHCRNCFEPGNARAGVPLKRGLCPQCYDGYRIALREIISIAKPKRDYLRTFGDEPGDAAADAYQIIIREARKRLR